MYDEYVIKGNAAVLKCNIPSFVSDHVEIVEWIDTNGGIYTRDADTGIETIETLFVCYFLVIFPLFCRTNPTTKILNLKSTSLKPKIQLFFTYFFFIHFNYLINIIIEMTSIK